MTPPELILDGLGFPESPHWHDDRLWLCNWGSGEVLAVAPDGERKVAARLAPATLPFSIDWLPDGRLLVIDGPRRLLLREDRPGELVTVADLGASFGPAPFNEIVAADDGGCYVNGGPGIVVHVSPDGTARQVADGLGWPNGMALLDGGRTLVVADSHAVALLAYAVGDDGALSPAREWAALEHAPDGICADASGAIWVASVPGRSCVRVREGGDAIDRVEADRGCFACMLGGADGRTLYVAAAEWHGMEAAMSDGPGTSGRLLAAPGQPEPHAGRP